MGHDSEKLERLAKLHRHKRDLRVREGRLLELAEPARGEELLIREVDAPIAKPDAVDGESVVANGKADVVGGVRSDRDDDFDVVDDL